MSSKRWRHAAEVVAYLTLLAGASFFWWWRLTDGSMR